MWTPQCSCQKISKLTTALGPKNWQQENLWTHFRSHFPQHWAQNTTNNSKTVLTSPASCLGGWSARRLCIRCCLFLSSFWWCYCSLQNTQRRNWHQKHLIHNSSWRLVVKTSTPYCETTLKQNNDKNSNNDTNDDDGNENDDNNNSNYTLEIFHNI